MTRAVSGARGQSSINSQNGITSQELDENRNGNRLCMTHLRAKVERTRMMTT